MSSNKASEVLEQFQQSLTTKNVLIGTGSAAALFALTLACSSSFRNTVQRVLIKTAKVIPGASLIVEKEKQKALAQMTKALGKDDAGERDVFIPKEGLGIEAVLQEVDKLKNDDCDWEHGKAFGFVYHGGAEHMQFLDQVYAKFSHTNPLHSTAFPSVQRMEAEVVRMVANMMNGGRQAAGTMTSGGTESLLLAMKTYRDKFRAEKGITKPEVIVAQSAHAAFQKAGHYFGIKMVVVPVGEDKRIDIVAVKKAINKNTIALVGSAPSYPHGVIDSITELAIIAKQKGLGLHVDCCLGGFIVPWLKKLGYNIPDFDFRVDGVTSISADLHKYGFSAKGCSVILYKDEALCRYQFFTYADWSGGLYGSPSIAGSRPGGLIATSWAALRALGESGYMEASDKIMKAAIALQEGVNKIPGIRIVAKPDATIFAIEASDSSLDIFKVGESLGKKHWHVERQQFPNSLHCTVTYRHVTVVDVFLKDLKDSVEEVQNHPERFEDGMAPIYGMAAKMPDRSLIEEVMAHYFTTLYRV